LIFYVLFQGAVQGPEEFAEGVVLGVKGLFGATVGGGAGAVSRIAGTLGKGVAVLTLDEEYQRKRQQVMSRRPKTIGEGVARGAKGVGQGIYEGITGIVAKPLAGIFVVIVFSFFVFKNSSTVPNWTFVYVCVC
uniref:VPS13_C domain-containing protein n=1 Tax=Gongylonema pulchrum TaxID=637853 RepID=A0A183DKK8_9BILA